MNCLFDQTQNNSLIDQIKLFENYSIKDQNIFIKTKTIKNHVVLGIVQVDINRKLLEFNPNTMRIRPEFDWNSITLY